MSKARIAVVLAFVSAACAVEPSPEETAQIDQQSSAMSSKRKSFDVDFRQCTEIASLAPVPVANVRALVPAQYTLANESAGTTFVVVRVANCADATVDGKPDGAGTLAQVGVNLVSPDNAGDIDNYTLWYYTTSARLAAKLNSAGIRAQHVRRLSYALTTTATPGVSHLAIDVPGRPSFKIAGDVVPPTAAPVAYQAGWWRAMGHREAVMNTSFPAIQFSSATMTLTTAATGDLGRVFGAGSATFPIFDSYNAFSVAQMTVSRSR